MNILLEHITNKVRDRINSWNQALSSDIYAISFFLYDDEDDPRKPTLTLGYNTETHLKNVVPRASGEEEARWNYAFWPRTQECFVGSSNDSSLIRTWIESLGLWYDDLTEKHDFGRAMALGEAITKHFTELTATAAKRLHEDGTIMKKFGRTIPILIHGLEYCQTTAIDTERANPPNAAKGFVSWIERMCQKQKRTHDSTDDALNRIANIRGPKNQKL